MAYNQHWARCLTGLNNVLLQANELEKGGAADNTSRNKIHPFLSSWLRLCINITYIQLSLSNMNRYCRFQITFESLIQIECAVPKFVANLPITFPNSKIACELRNKVRNYISMFELL